MDLKLTDAELLALMPTWARSEDGVKWSKPAPLELTNLGVARFAADAATAKAAWGLLAEARREFPPGAFSPIAWGALSDMFEWWEEHLEAAGLPRPEEVAR